MTKKRARLNATNKYYILQIYGIYSNTLLFFNKKMEKNIQLLHK